jgi:TonB family protein
MAIERESNWAVWLHQTAQIKITDVRVVERSGDGTYDESVLRAVRMSSPLPPPPEKYRDVFGNYLLDFVSGELQS